MKLQLLGTAAAEGWPAVFCGCVHCECARALGGRNIRTRSQSLVNGALLIDLPADTYMHMLANNLKFHEIAHLIVTHSHGDHWYPQELAMRRPPFSQRNAGVFNVYGNDAVERGFNAICDANPSLSEHYRFNALQPFQTARAGKLTVTALRALHNRGEACLNYLISDGAKTLLYGLDTGVFPEDTWDFLKDKKIDAAVLDCTNQSGPEGTNHMGLPDNIIVRERLLATGAAHDKTVFIVNHFSHNGGFMHDEMEELAKKAGFLTAYDGMAVEF